MKSRHIPLPAFLLLSTTALLLQPAAQTLPSLPNPVPGMLVAETNNVPEKAEPTLENQLAPPPRKAEKLYDFTFEGATLDIVMEQYCEWTEKIYLKNDAVNANITLKASKLTRAECIQVVDAILGMNNIALVPMGDKFIKVVQANAPDLVGQGLAVNTDPEKEYMGTEKLVTQIMQLEHIEITDVQAAVQHLMHAYGKILPLTSSNCLMITDTEANIERVRELLEFIDQPSAQIEPRIYNIRYAEAGEIASTLTEIISMAQEGQKTPASTARTPPGVVRARTSRTTRPSSTPTATTIASTAGGGALSIQGNVKVISDERTNIIIVFSQEENFEFFDKIIKVLDVEVDPAITFEVVNLEYADAEELAGTLNELVGAATGGSGGSASSRTSRSSTSRSSSSSRSRTSGIQRASGSTSSRSSSPIGNVTPNASPSEPASIENLSRLSEETRILADARSNSVLLMGEKSDIAALKEVIKSLDVMLEQVVIEAAIFEIGLDEDLRHGVDWLYKGLDKNGQTEKLGAWDGQSLVTNTVNSLVSGAFNYYQNLSGLDSQMLINLSKTDQDARLISTPVIMTTDNTEATLSIGEQRPVVTSTDSYSSTGGSLRSNYEYKDIGIQLTVTPRINPQRFVVMELTQKADQIGTIVEIDGNEVPTILNREFEASIAVPDGGTVVLGGLMSTDVSDTVNKIPILGDIPLIGRYLFSSVTQIEKQRELIVLMTPYVMTNMAEMQDQTEHLYQGTSILQEDWKGSWSDSKLRQIPDPEEE